LYKSPQKIAKNPIKTNIYLLLIKVFISLELLNPLV